MWHSQLSTISVIGKPERSTWGRWFGGQEPDRTARGYTNDAELDPDDQPQPQPDELEHLAFPNREEGL